MVQGSFLSELIPHDFCFFVKRTKILFKQGKKKISK